MVVFSWPGVQQKDDAVTGLTKGIEYLFQKNGVRYVKGKGSFADANTVKVDLTVMTAVARFRRAQVSLTHSIDCWQGGGTENITAKNVIIATGSDVMDLPGIKVGR